MLKKFFKKIFKRISINYSEVIDKIDSVDEKNSKKLELMESKINSLEQTIENNYKQIQENINIKAINNASELNILKERTRQLEYCNLELACEKPGNNLKKVLIIGFYGALNLGDELMLETLLDHLQKFNGLDITVLLADNPSYDVEKYKAIKFIHYPKTIFDFNRLAEIYDYFIFGGGAIIDDTNFEKENSYKYDLGTILIKLSLRAIAFEKHVVALGLSASTNLTNSKYIEKLEYIINNSEYFSTRDEFSYNLISEKCTNLNKSKLNVIQDIALANENLRNINADHNIKTQKSLKIGVIWICTDNKEKCQELIFDINKYLEINNYKECEINLIPFYNYLDNDSNFYKQVKDTIVFKNNKINITEYANSAKELMDIIKNQNIIISLRYHGILVSYAANVPCVSVCYDIHNHYNNKVSYLNKIFKKSQAINYSNLSYENLTQKIDYVIKNDNSKLDTSIMDNAQHMLDEALNQIFD